METAKAKGHLAVVALLRIAAVAPDLLEVLHKLSLTNKPGAPEAAEAWCTANEPHSIKEILEAEMVDDFVGSLRLQRIPASRLRNALLLSAEPQQPAASSSLDDDARETRTIDGETYTLEEQLNIDGNAEIWRVVDERGHRYASARAYQTCVRAHTVLRCAVDPHPSSRALRRYVLKSCDAAKVLLEVKARKAIGWNDHGNVVLEVRSPHATPRPVPRDHRPHLLHRSSADRIKKGPT